MKGKWLFSGVKLVVFVLFAAAAVDGTADVRATAGRLNALFEYNLLRENSPGRYSFHDLVRRHARSRAPGDTRS